MFGTECTECLVGECPPFLSLLRSAHIWVLIYREAAEQGNGEAQRYRNAGDTEIPEMGEERSPYSHLLDADLFDVEGLCCPSLPFYMGSLGSFCRFFGVF